MDHVIGRLLWRPPVTPGPATRCTSTLFLIVRPHIIGPEPPDQASRDHDYVEPGPAPVARPHHRRRHLGARVLPAVPQRQSRRKSILRFCPITLDLT